MSTLYLALSAGISEMRVLIGDQVVLCYVVQKLQTGVAYISPELAESIKQTHIPPKENGPLRNVWQPHVPKHVHYLMELSPGAQPARGGNRAWTSKTSKLASGTTAYDAEARRRYREKRAEEKKEQQTCPTTKPEDSIPSHATA